MRKSIIELVHDHAMEMPAKIAVVCDGVETSYQELFKMASLFALHLKDKGIVKGDIIVAKATQSLEYVVTYLGVHLSGAVITSVEKSTPTAEVAKLVDKVSAKAVIFDDAAITELTDALFIPCSDVMQVAKGPDQDVTWEFPAEDDSADILYTTGTTGASKGVELSHKALVATAENLICGCKYTKDIVLIVPGPLNHANPIRKLFTTLVNGSTIYILNGMTNMKKFYDALDYPCEKVACCLPPSSIRMIFTLSQDKIKDYADKIDFIESATAPLPEPDKIRLSELLPKTRLINNYGSSESASVCMYDYNENPGLVGCVGKAMPNSRIFIVDDNGNEMQSSKDNMGLLACDGDVNMKGYVNEPELTKEVLINGVVYTNDIGYIDENGFVYVSGRKGDVINVGGLKVAPTDVEAVALAYEELDDCICIPMDHPITGKALKLLVVVKDKETFQAKALRSFIASRVEGYKVPSKIEIVDQVARTYNGKLDRKFYL